ncbi:hypothetical protein ACC759_38335, partial [Rhizobium ruizarguesonis]
ALPHPSWNPIFSCASFSSARQCSALAGRGSFIESFPLFGYNLEEYDQLFKEKLDLLLALRDREVVEWKGELRAPGRAGSG